MFDRFFRARPSLPAAAQSPDGHAPAETSAGDTATVRRIVAKLEAMPAERARLIASAAYTLARAAHADLEISDAETAAIEHELQTHDEIDEASAVLVTEMAKLQARTVGGTEDFVVTREFSALATDTQKIDVLRACFAIGAASGTISAEESAIINQIAKELGIDDPTLNSVRAAFHEQLSSVQEIRRVTPGN